MKAKLTFSTVGEEASEPSLVKMNMCIDKSYITLVSAIYTSQCCNTAPRESEPENVEGYIIDCA